MDCTRFEDLLFASLDSALAADQQRQLREHARKCDRCNELAAAMFAEEGDEPAAVPNGLLPAVLEHTTGGSCERAVLLLAQRADAAEDGLAAQRADIAQHPSKQLPDRAVAPSGQRSVGLGDLDAELLANHLRTCGDCDRVARALARLRRELPALADLDPGEGFVDAVMSATAGTVEPARASLWETMLAACQRAVLRPRFAFEAAYGFVVVAILLFGLPSGSFAQLPARAFDSIHREGMDVERAVSSGLGELAEIGRTTWSGSKERAASYFDEVAAADSGADSAQRDSGAWIGAARGFAADLWNRLFAPLADLLRALWGAPADPNPKPGADL